MWLPGPVINIGLFFKWVSEWVKSLSCVQLYATPWTVACQVPPSMGFSRQDYWSGLPFPSPGDLPDSGIEPWSPTLQAGFTVWATREKLSNSFPKFMYHFLSHCQGGRSSFSVLSPAVGTVTGFCFSYSTVCMSNSLVLPCCLDLHFPDC